LIPLSVEGGPIRYDVQTSEQSIKNSIGRGLAWLTQNFNASANPVMGQSPYYGLYGVERIGALGDKSALASVRWFDTGMQFITTSQGAGGNWSAQHGDVPNTAWAILFMTKSTAKSVRRIEIKKLGGGTLVGGRGLPTDLTSLTVAGGRVLVRPMNGAIEGMLAVLEDARAQNADSALAGLVARYQKEGPRLLRPYKDRFRRLLSDRDPGVRKVAAWALGHTADLDATPALISALEDRDDGVVAEARAGLQILSRKIDGYGPAEGASAAEKHEAAKKWLAWYDEARPPDVVSREEDAVSQPGPAKSVAKPGGTR
jgi:hypothetical protein